MSAIAQKWDVAEYLLGDGAAIAFAGDGSEVETAINQTFTDEGDADIRRALMLYSEGKVPQHSSGICETHTAGYGKLDENGYWEFPLPANFVERFLSFKRAK